MEQNQQQKFACSGDCLNCRINPNERKTQWQYCAAQFTYNSMRMIEALHNELTTLSGTVEELRERIEAIQNSEADVFYPVEEKSEIPTLQGSSENPTEHNIAQEGSGV